MAGGSMQKTRELPLWCAKACLAQVPNLVIQIRQEALTIAEKSTAGVGRIIFGVEFAAERCTLWCHDDFVEAMNGAWEANFGRLPTQPTSSVQRTCTLGPATSSRSMTTT